MVYTITQSNEMMTNSAGRVLWEFLWSFAVSLPFFTLGIETCLSEPFDNAFIFYNITTMWHQTAMLVAAAISAPVFAFISQRFGRKAGYFCISLVQGLLFIPVFIRTEASLPYTYILLGITSGGVPTVLLPYIREITSIKARGICLTVTATMLLAGYQLRVVVREWYDPMTYVVVALVAVQLMLVMGIVESPSYLVIVGKTELAKAALSSLKRLPEDSPVIMKEINNLNGDVSRGTKGETTLLSLYRNKICWDSIKMGVLLYTTMELCGSIIFLDAKNACDCIGLRDSNIIVAFVLMGSILTIVIINFWDRKYILTFGYGAMAVSLGVYAVFSQFSSASSVGTALVITSSVALSVLLIAYGMVSALPAVLIVEMFNTKICTPILAALLTYSQLLKLLHAHTFQYLEKYAGIHTMFYVFAGINLYGGVYVLFVVPNIRNKNLKQIEKQVKRIPLPA